MTQIILISYGGTQLSEKDVAVLAGRLTDILNGHAISGSVVDIATLTKEELINRILGMTSVKEMKIPTEEEAIENAVVYIGEKFKQFLTGSNASYVGFVVALTEALHKDDDLLKKSAYILSTHSGKVKSATARKYGFTKSIFEAIAQVYSCLN